MTIEWRQWPDIKSERLPPFDGEDFLLAQRNDPSFSHEPDFQAYFVLTVFYDREDQSFYHRIDGPAERIPYPDEQECFWSESNLPDQRG